MKVSSGCEKSVFTCLLPSYTRTTAFIRITQSLIGLTLPSLEKVWFLFSLVWSTPPFGKTPRSSFVGMRISSANDPQDLEQLQTVRAAVGPAVQQLYIQSWTCVGISCSLWMPQGALLGSLWIFLILFVVPYQKCLSVLPAQGPYVPRDKAIMYLVSGALSLPVVFGMIWRWSAWQRTNEWSKKRLQLKFPLCSSVSSLTAFILIIRRHKVVFTTEEVRLNDHQLNHILSLFFKPMVISCFWHYPSAILVSCFLSFKSLIKSSLVYLVIINNIKNDNFGFWQCEMHMFMLDYHPSMILIKILNFQNTFFKL